jgi:hypothetical protein
VVSEFFIWHEVREFMGRKWEKGFFFSLIFNKKKKKK